MKPVVIQSKLSLLRRTAGPVLVKTGETVPAGTRMLVGEEETLHFNGVDQPSLPVEWEGAVDGTQRYVLKSEYLKSWVS